MNDSDQTNEASFRLTEKHLLDAGYDPGPWFRDMLAAAAVYQERGIQGKKYLLKLLARDFGAPRFRLPMLDCPAPYAEAILAQEKAEKDNLAIVRKQMDSLMRVPVIRSGAIMPDACPVGKEPAAMPVGGVIAAHQAIIPSAHSSDICCSMYATFYEERGSVAAELDALTTATRFGTGHRHLDDLVHHPVLDENVWLNPFLSGLRDRAHAHLADQGDGNHFAFLGQAEVTSAWLAQAAAAGHSEMVTALTPYLGKILRVLVTHHGSRGLGAHVFKRGQNAAEKHTAKHGDHIPDNGAWLDAESPEGQAYWEALQYVARWTRANHQCIHSRFLTRIGATGIHALGNEHNFVWKRGDLYLHGKGATPAWRDEQDRPLLGLIPMNMAEPILLVLGGDNPDYLGFAPHGAGRNLSRTALRRLYPDEDDRRNVIRHSTRDIDVRWYCGKPDLSETPIAYKNAARIREQIEQFRLAQVLTEIYPLGCIMAGSSGKSWRDKEEELTPKQKRQLEHRSDRRKVRQHLREMEDE
jgi:tRNA-splicing ligase RtcB